MRKFLAQIKYYNDTEVLNLFLFAENHADAMKKIMEDEDESNIEYVTLYAGEESNVLLLNDEEFNKMKENLWF